MKYFIISIVFIQFMYSSDSTNVALTSQPFVIFIGQYPMTGNNGNIFVDTAKINPKNLIDGDYFSVIAFPPGNIGSSIGIKMQDSMQVSSVSFTSLGNLPYGYNIRIRAYSIYGSRDSINWFKLKQETNNLDSGFHISYIKSLNRSKYLKITIDSMDRSSYSVLSELGVYVSNIPASVDDGVINSMTTYSIQQNYPNPFNPSTQIEYSLLKDGFVSLRIYDMLGREISILVNEEKVSGKYSVQWNASKFNTGVYIVKYLINNILMTKKMIYLK